MIVADPFGAAADPVMPQLAVALDPKKAGALLKRGLPHLTGETGALRIRAITVLRYKPSKRCVIEYRAHLAFPGEEPRRLRIIGKTRARRFGQANYRLQQEFWDGGFSGDSADLISVPEPLGHLPELQMWFQEKVKGELGTTLFTPDAGVEFAARIADAAFKIHQAKIPASKSHTMEDELKILENCFLLVEASHPGLRPRLRRVWELCRALGETLGPRPGVGIHRDFYSDQVILHRNRIYLLDFDLYCQGDPALDIGNFTGHLTELSLRLWGRNDALNAHASALVDRYCEVAGDSCRRAIQVYHQLTLARHVYLSTLFEDRRTLTEPLLDLCEDLCYSTRTL